MRIRLFTLLFSLLLAVPLLTACGQPEPEYVENTAFPASAYATPDWQVLPPSLPDSLKGYELYSWQTGDDWIFTLITGTNRVKSFDEITSIENQLEDGYLKVTVTSIEDLQTLLKRLPAGVDLIWSGIDLTGEVEEGTIYFTYPPEEMIEQVVAVAEEQGVVLHTLNTP